MHEPMDAASGGLEREKGNVFQRHSDPDFGGAAVPDVDRDQPDSGGAAGSRDGEAAPVAPCQFIDTSPIIGDTSPTNWRGSAGRDRRSVLPAGWNCHQTAQFELSVFSPILPDIVERAR